MVLNLDEYNLIYANDTTLLIFLLQQSLLYSHLLDIITIILMHLNHIIPFPSQHFSNINYLLLFHNI